MCIIFIQNYSGNTGRTGMQTTQNLPSYTNKPLTQIKLVPIDDNMTVGKAITETACFMGKFTVRITAGFFVAPISLLTLTTGSIAGITGLGAGLVGGGIYKTVQQYRGKSVEPISYYAKNVARQTFRAGCAFGIALGVVSYFGNIPATLVWGAVSLGLGAMASASVTPLVLIGNLCAVSDQEKNTEALPDKPVITIDLSDIEAANV